MAEDIQDTPEYRLGWEWAREHGPILAELFSGREVATPELRTRLFREASRRWPSQRDSLDNDLRQTAFVAGAFKAAIETLNLDAEGAAAIMDAALEMGMIWGAEQAKIRHLEALKQKPRGWWQRKFGDATPNSVVGALSIAWRREWSKVRGRPHPGSRWAVLIDTLGSREMAALATLERITEHRDGDYVTWNVEGTDGEFTVLAQPVYDDGRIIRYPGEITG